MPTAVPERGPADARVPGAWTQAVATFGAATADSDVEQVAVLLDDGDLVPFDNLHPQPEYSFRCDAERWCEVIRSAVLVIHTHPLGDAWPSWNDQAQQIATGLPWAILPKDGEPFIFGDDARPPDLRRRPYRWGVTDCFSLVRDALREWGFGQIRNYPRRWGATRKGESLFEQHLDAEEYVRVGDRLADAEAGDVLLWRLHCKVANHCGIVSQPGHMLHHATPDQPYQPTYLPREERLERWQRFPVTVYRHAA